MSPQGTYGFGAASRLEGLPATSPNHAFDSATPGTADMVLLSFDKAVILSQFGFGWVGTDSDVSILRWTGDTAPTTADSATTPAVGDKDNLTGDVVVGASTTAGWRLVGHYADAGTAKQLTSATLASSWWLISTYNTTLFGSGTCTDFNGGTETCDADGKDAFKLNFLKTANYTCPEGTLTPGGNCTKPPETPGVPEPGTLALAAMAFLGLTVNRRRLKTNG